MVSSESLYREVGRKIKARRDELDLTQEALASQVSLTRTSITNIEKGRQKLLLHTLIDIATALKVNPASLLPSSTETKNHELDAKLQRLPIKERNWIKKTLGSSATRT